jgi:pyrroloquinoline quinone biosynthesis protein B
MLIKVLGSAAGGGFPQWNCNCRNCSDARKGLKDLKPRTQSSLAVSADVRDFVLLDASPDLRQQITDTSELHPVAGTARSSPIKAVVLTNGDVDHVAGLLNMREGQPFTLYATDRVLKVLESNSVFNVLDKSIVRREAMWLGRPFTIQGPAGFLGLEVEAFSVPGKIALYLEDEQAGENFGTEEGDTVGLKLTEKGSGRYFFYIPGCAALDDELRVRLKHAPLVFFDGTLYRDDEMIGQGLLNKTGTRMGHLNMSGSDGSIAAFEDLEVQRKIFIHVNNSNPALRKGSPERQAIEAAGWEIGYDGMEVAL